MYLLMIKTSQNIISRHESLVLVHEPDPQILAIGTILGE